MADIIGMQPAGRVLPLFKGDYDNDIVYEQTDVVLYNASSYIAIQDTVGNAPPEPDVNRNECWQLVAKGMTDISDSTVKFTQAETRADIKSGETSSTLFGKIMKWFTDLKPHCFISPVNNLLVNVPGTAMDAAVGPGIDSRITANTNAIDQLNSDINSINSPVTISNPASTYEIWSKLCDSYKTFANNRYRVVYIIDEKRMIDSEENGHWTGILSIYNGNISGILINLWTDHATVITAADYSEGEIRFKRLTSQ